MTNPVHEYSGAVLVKVFTASRDIFYLLSACEIFYNEVMYSRRQYKVSVPLKKTRCPTAYQHFTAFIRSQFLRAIFRLTPPKSINRRAEVIDELE